MKLFLALAALYLIFSIAETKEKAHFFLESSNSIRPAKSCLDFLRDGVVESGFYQIFDDKNNRNTVFCDFTSEPGSAWTLVMSYELDRRFMTQFRRVLQSNSPVNTKTANWKAYRMSHDMMASVASQSTHWRYTCSFAEYGVDYRDYARATLTSLNPLTFKKNGQCARMEYINVRGRTCAQCKAQWWQVKSKKQRILHMDSYKNRCQLKSGRGAVKWEDNFGSYDNINRKFRCTESGSSTTNLWFGGYLQ